MHRAMDSVFDQLKQPPEELILFLTDANPYMWEDRTAADPALQSDFEAAMDRQNIGTEVDATTAYRAVKQFLDEQYSHFASLVPDTSKRQQSSTFAELFATISLDEWNRLYARVVEEETNS